MQDAMLDRAKATASGAQTLALVAFWLITVTLAINYGVLTYRALAGTAEASFLEKVRALAPAWVSILPAILFLDALTRLRRALSEYEAGRFFSPRSAKAVRQAGEQAVAGLIAKMVVAPTLIVWIRREAPFDLDFELIDLALLAFLGFFAALARVLDLAVAVKAENDQIV